MKRSLDKQGPFFNHTYTIHCGFQLKWTH